MDEIFINSRDPDQMPHSTASDLGLHCLPITLLDSPDYTFGLRDIMKFNFLEQLLQVVKEFQYKG